MPSGVKRQAALACLLIVPLFTHAAGDLADCPATPNCVSSQAHDPARRVPSITANGPVEVVFSRLKATLVAEAGTRVVEEDQVAGYLRAESTSRLFGFVDDVEFRFDGQENVLHIRSASRVGYWDLGVNRRRAERIRERFGLPNPPRVRQSP